MNDAYLDFASTTPVHPAALEQMMRVANSTWGDPSRLYGAARSARIVLDQARSDIAGVLGARPEEITFTSGGTESCNLAVIAGARAAAASRKPRRILVSAIEHTAILEAARSVADFEVVEIPVDSMGIIKLDVLRDECSRGAGLVSIQHANQEIGTLQPTAEAAAIAHESGAIVHTDACLSLGHIPVDIADLGVDLVSGSSHKSYGPKGAGLLWSKRSVKVRPLIVGDDRERHRRAGIENLPAVAGFAAALQARAIEAPAEEGRLRGWTNQIQTELPTLIDRVIFHGDPARTLPGICAFTIEGVEGESALLMLDQQGIGVHSGSSCTSSATEPSHVLTAIGAPTTGSVRISLGSTTTQEHVDRLLHALPPIVEKLRGLGGLNNGPSIE
ncbi:MAG: cysteine desulfurase family protein [Actinomycetota bacterium]